MIVIDSHKKLLAFWDSLRNQFEKHHYLRVEVKEGQTRTSQQNAALHKWCTDLSNTLNAAGMDFRHFYKEGVKIPFNPQLVKDYVWRPVQKAVTGQDSTTKPTPQQYLEIYEIIARHLAEKHNIIVDWPTIEGKRGK